MSGPNPARAPHLRTATKADTPEMSRVLSEAFATSKTFSWIVPDDAARRRLLPAFFSGQLSDPHTRLGSQVAELPGAAPALAGVAVWTAPGRWKPRWWHQFRTLPRLLRSADRATLRQFADRGPEIDRGLSAIHPDEPHWYLAALGVDPTSHGTGVGTALLHEGLRRADAAGEPCYLECEDHLVDYYRRFGFEIIARADMPEGAPPQQGMWRAPAA